jgi:hypothetical protein
MTQRSSAALATASCYEDMPFSVVLFRFLWPFWLFRDASHGDRFARAAAYRHNRDMRVYLPGYLMKWLLSASCVLGLTSGIDSLARSLAPTSTILSLVSAVCAIAFACSVCVLFITVYIYLYLGRHE